MKLVLALKILREVADREVSLRQMVLEANEWAIYEEMRRRWLVWSGKGWIQVRLISKG